MQDAHGSLRFRARRARLRVDDDAQILIRVDVRRLQNRMAMRAEECFGADRSDFVDQPHVPGRSGRLVAHGDCVAAVNGLVLQGERADLQRMSGRYRWTCRAGGERDDVDGAHVVAEAPVRVDAHVVAARDGFRGEGQCEGAGTAREIAAPDFEPVGRFNPVLRARGIAQRVCDAERRSAVHRLGRGQCHNVRLRLRKRNASYGEQQQGGKD